MKQWLGRFRAKGLLAAYAAALALWLLWALVCFGVDRAFGEQVLSPGQAQAAGIVAEGDEVYRTTDGDPRWEFIDLKTGARKVVLLAEFENDPGEMSLYYALPGLGNIFGWAAASGKPVEGGYEYTLLPSIYSGLRIDPGTLADNRVTVRAIVLNPTRPFVSYFVPTLRGLLAFAALPALAYAAFCIIIETNQTLRPRIGRKKG